MKNRAKCKSKELIVARFGGTKNIGLDAKLN
jgi:hypothetical protein